MTDTSAAPRERLIVEKISTADGLEKLRPEWSLLWSRCSDASPFQAPHWLIPWWREFGCENEMCVLAIREDGRLVGLLPLFLINGRGGGSGRQLFLMGTGISDYLDGLFDDLQRDSIAATAIEWLFSYGPRWNECDFQELRRESPLLKLKLPNGYRSETRLQSICPFLRLPSSAAEFERSLPSGISKRLRRYRRRIGNAGKVELVGRDNFDSLFDALLELHRSRWNSLGQPGVLALPELVRFNREAARGFLETGGLRLALLKIDGRPAASFYGLRCSKTTFGYLQGFAPAFEKLSAGTVLMGEIIETAVSDGDNKFDFLRGSETYKYAWGAQNRFSYSRRIYRK